MHEMSIVQALIDQVTGEVEQSRHQGRVLRLELAIGRMSGVHVDALRFAFELLSPGTLVEQAELDIEQPRAVCECHSCGSRQDIEQLILSCAACGSDAVSIKGGQDMLLKSIELEDE